MKSSSTSRRQREMVKTKMRIKKIHQNKRISAGYFFLFRLGKYGHSEFFASTETNRKFTTNETGVTCNSNTQAA